MEYINIIYYYLLLLFSHFQSRLLFFIFIIYLKNMYTCVFDLMSIREHVIIALLQQKCRMYVVQISSYVCIFGKIMCLGPNKPSMDRYNMWVLHFCKRNLSPKDILKNFDFFADKRTLFKEHLHINKLISCAFLLVICNL